MDYNKFKLIEQVVEIAKAHASSPKPYVAKTMREVFDELKKIYEES